MLKLADLSLMHPKLMWDSIILATVAVAVPREGSLSVDMTFENVPNFGDGREVLQIIPPRVEVAQLEKVEHTFESQRLVEMAAIGIAGLMLFYAGGHEIHDVAFRGSGADYWVAPEQRLLEIAGRSNRRDMKAALSERWDRLMSRLGSNFFVCVVEFETPSGHLVFAT